MLLAKTDIESAFHVLPVHPDSLQLLGCFWDGGYFVDRCLPMGCLVLTSRRLVSSWSGSCKMRWGFPSVIHYLDDFLSIGSAQNQVCLLLLHTMERVVADFGVPLVCDKMEGPLTCVWIVACQKRS